MGPGGSGPGGSRLNVTASPGGAATKYSQVLAKNPEAVTVSAEEALATP